MDLSQYRTAAKAALHFPASMIATHPSTSLALRAVPRTRELLQLLPRFNFKDLIGCTDLIRQVAVIGLLVVPQVFHQANAQNFDFNPPNVQVTDENGVDHISGNVQLTLAPISIGTNDNPLTYWEKYSRTLANQNGGWYGSASGGNNFYTYPSGYITINVLGQAEIFYKDTNNTYQSWTGMGGQLTVSNGSVTQYVDRNGVRYGFNILRPVAECTNNLLITQSSITEVKTYTPVCSVLDKVTYPDGRIVQLSPIANSLFGTSVVRNDGLALHIDYINPIQLSALTPWSLTSKVTAVNLAVDYCDVTALSLSCNFSRTWPTANFNWSPITSENVGDLYYLNLTDSAGRVSKYTEAMVAGLPQGNNYRALVSVKSSSSPAADTTNFQVYSTFACVPAGANSYWDCSTSRAGLVQNVTSGTGTWHYDYGLLYSNVDPRAPEAGLWKTQSTRSDGFNSTVIYNVKTTYIQSVTGSDGGLNYDPGWATRKPNRLNNGTDAEGRYFTFLYDDRGNVTQKQQVANGGAGALGPIIKAGYDAVCVYPAKCNKPNWTMDALGNQTDYTYDSVHGGVLTKTLPADVNGVRPQNRYSYVQRYAWLKNAMGTYSPSASPIWVLSQVSQCNRGAAASSGVGCVISGDESVTTYDYGPDSGPNNLWLRGQVGSAMNSQGQTESRRTCYAYDPLGNKISETSPGAGLSSCP